MGFERHGEIMANAGDHITRKLNQKSVRKISVYVHQQCHTGHNHNHIECTKNKLVWLPLLLGNKVSETLEPKTFTSMFNFIRWVKDDKSCQECINTIS